MNALTDHRPHVFREAPADEAFGIPECLALTLTKLLHEYPDIEITTIRLWQHVANGVATVRVDARRGQLAEPECPSCHTVAGHPHTEYCQLVDFESQLTHAELEPRLAEQIKARLRQPCSNPHANGLDGRGCQDETCPRHGDPSIDDCPPEGPPCYTLNPDGITTAGTQCIDPACHYPNPHTHPDLLA